MSKKSPSSIEDYIETHEKKSLLRFITCGSVDDGKSTLIGRMLYEAEVILDDQMEALTLQSKKHGTTGDDIDFALLVDGLSAEREQGITIDVAYRFFSTDKRRFVIADTPGHEQYTRNMATGASHSDLAIVMIDSRKGVLSQTMRHSFIVSMLGIKHVVLAVNKMDMIDYDQDPYEEIKNNYLEMVSSLGFESIQVIPVSAVKGVNVANRSKETPWYKGPSLFAYLETINIDTKSSKEKDFRMSVQWVNRPNLDFRGFSGEVSSGKISVGDNIIALPSHKSSSVKSIVTYDGELDSAERGKAVTITLNDEVDISRGDVLSSIDNPCNVADIFKVRLLWMSDKPLITGRQFIFRLGTIEALCTVSRPDYIVDVNTMEHLSAKSLNLNEICVADIVLDRPIAYEDFEKNKHLGSFVLIRRITHETVAMGMIKHSMRRSENVQVHKLDINRDAREEMNGHKSCVIWMTGLSGAGKSTIANALEKKLYAQGKHTMLLDGDNIRRGLNQDLSFSEGSRAENIRRVAEVSKLMSEAGLITLVSFISPFKVDRQSAKEIIGEDIFIEAYIDTPLEEAERRDVKGLYKKARSGEIPNFTGIGSPYEAPENPELSLNTIAYTAEELADQVIDYINKKGISDE